MLVLVLKFSKISAMKLYPHPIPGSQGTFMRSAVIHIDMYDFT
jgi:hypothetical protein